MTSISIESMLRTEELTRRPSRMPDYQSENQALLTLAQELTNSPENVLQKLADVALALCRGHSAGISLLEEGPPGNLSPRGDRFRWHAVAGQWAPLIWNTTTRRDFGPCGTVLDHNCTQLFANAHHYYSQFAEIEPLLIEALLVPLYVGGQAVGTVWVVAHDDSRKFDAEDQRLLESLAAFAATAYQIRVSIAAQEKTNQDLLVEVTERKQAEVALRDSQVWLAGQSEALQAAVNGESLEASLGALVRTVVEQSGEGDNTRAAFYLASPDGLELHHVVGMPDSYAKCVDGFKIGPDSLACGLAVYTGKPITTYDVMTEPLWKPWRWLAEKHDFRAVWSFPVQTSAGRMVGTFAMYLREPRNLTPRYQQLVAVLTQVAAIIISRHQEANERARAEAALRKSEGRLAAEAGALSRLNEASSRLWQMSNLSEGLDEMLAATIDLLGADMGNIQLLDGGILRIAVQRGFGSNFLDFFREVTSEDESACGRTLRAGSRTWIEDVETDANYEALRPIARAAGYRAVQSTPLMSRGGKPLGMVSTHFRSPRRSDEQELRRLDLYVRQAADFIERYKAEQQLRKLAADLSEADRRKSEFLAMLAHELRNPLAPIRNAVEVLRRSWQDEHKLRPATEMIQRQIDHMVRLVDDLLDVSRISRGKIELRREPLELASVIQQAVETIRPLCKSMGHELTVTLPHQPMLLNADPIRLTQVVSNLLNNACKFTMKGGRILLTVEQEGTKVVIRLQDTGIGIAAEQLAPIFDVFTQVDTSLDRSRGGLGLGLTLVNNLVEMHDGTVEARSAGIGHGSEFVVRLPLLSGSALPRDPSTVEPVVTNRRSILVVDDNRDAAESLAMLLKIYGHEVHIAHDGLEAVEAASRLRLDVILLDIGLPGVDGYEAARRIRAQQREMSLMLVALTGWGQEEDRRRSEQAGFDAHMVKPVDFAALTKLLAESGTG